MAVCSAAFCREDRHRTLRNDSGGHVERRDPGDAGENGWRYYRDRLQRQKHRRRRSPAALSEGFPPVPGADARQVRRAAGARHTAILREKEGPRRSAGASSQPRHRPPVRDRTHCRAPENAHISRGGLLLAHDSECQDEVGSLLGSFPHKYNVKIDDGWLLDLRAYINFEEAQKKYWKQAWMEDVDDEETEEQFYASVNRWKQTRRLVQHFMKYFKRNRRGMYIRRIN